MVFQEQYGFSEAVSCVVSSLVLDSSSQGSSFVIGVTGGSGSGKSCFSEMLSSFLENIGISSVVVHMDHYYQNEGEAHFEGDEKPWEIDMDLFLAQFEGLISGYDVMRPNFLYDEKGIAYRCSKSSTLLRAAQVVIVEGLCTFDSRIIDDLDLRVYVEASDKSRLKRRIARDKTERNRSAKQTKWYWENYVQEEYEQETVLQKKHSDLVIVNEFES